MATQRLTQIFTKTATALAFVTATTALASGPEWVEDMDAGNSPGTAQNTVGNGQLGVISGSLDGLGVNGNDFEDMYFINIIEPTVFSITTETQFGGNTSFDSQLFLFEYDALNAFGILANDDSPITFGDGGGSGASFLNGQATDNTGFVLTNPGIYLLAITAFDNDPLSDTGPIFNQDGRNEISGPDGSGAGDPFAMWSNNINHPEGPGAGSYRIAMQGIGFANLPAPGSFALLLTAAAIGHRRRR